MRSRNNVIDLQENVINKLQSNEIYPFSVIFSYDAGDSDGILSITLYLKEDIDTLLNLLDYSSQCDKSGFTIIRESNTILLTDMALVNFYLKL